MGEVVVSPRSVQWPKEKRRKGERGTGFSLLHRSCTSWWASPVKTATPCAPSPPPGQSLLWAGFRRGNAGPLCLVPPSAERLRDGIALLLQHSHALHQLAECRHVAVQHSRCGHGGVVRSQRLPAVTGWHQLQIAAERLGVVDRWFPPEALL